MLKEVDFKWKDYKVVPISTTVLFLIFYQFIIRKNRVQIKSCYLTENL